ncbi:MAG: dipicolinate synthase subunit B, partial [Clostridia bacterium]|nr:dipicolinate synthase subunit B [Clostridia bacterium]
HTIPEAEPIGPKRLLDALVIAPCTGNTLAKLALGVTDTSVTMAAKAQLRNRRPVIIALSTNDALSANLKNIGLLMNAKNVYFVPFGQDDPAAKESSLTADMKKLPEAVFYALSGRQLQPVLI